MCTVGKSTTDLLFSKIEVRFELIFFFSTRVVIKNDMKVTFSVILSKQFNPLLFIPYASIVGDEWRMDNTSFAYVSDVRCMYKHKPQRLKQSFYINITATAAQSVNLDCGRSSVRIPATTDLSRKKRQ